MMQILMQKTAAGPDGTYQAGNLYAVEDAIGTALIAGGAAVKVDAGAVDEVATAVDEMETAVKPKPAPRRRKKE